MHHLRNTVIVLVASLALVACSGTSSSAPQTLPAIDAAGQYSGTVVDSVSGQATATLTVAQHGSSLGGTLSTTSGTTTVVQSVALSISGTSLSGSDTFDVNGSACTVAVTGTDTNGAVSATFTGASGCTRTGSWTLTQTCTSAAQSVDRQTKGVIPAC